MDDMDWKAAMNSEVFREYYKLETAKMVSQPVKTAEQTETEELQVLEDFQNFQRQVRASPKQLQVFRALQQKFASDPEYTSKVKKSFVDAVMLLDLD